MTREEAIERLKNIAWLYGSVEREQNIEAIDMAIEALSVDGPQGKWIKEYNGDGWNDYWDYKCSNCGKVYERAGAILYDANFCPNCGKRMKGGDTV